MQFEFINFIFLVWCTWLNTHCIKGQENDDVEYVYAPKNCTRNETITKTITETQVIRSKYRTCTFLWFGCRYKIRFKQVTRTFTQVITTEENICCEGYADNGNGSCKKACATGMFGHKCDQNCSCPENAHKDCGVLSGNCTCLPGKTGHLCMEVCANGFYGEGCNQPCLCKYNSTCNPIDGNCTCSPGYTGKHCDQNCGDGFYGLNCSFECFCLPDQICDHRDGCICKSGRTGENCTEECPEFVYGHKCSSDCQCEIQQTESCNAVNGSCLCKPGWEGDICDIPCLNNRYGQNCASECNCKNESYCEPVTGSCIPNCLCYGKGTTNCDETMPSCACKIDLKDVFCKAVNLSYVPKIQRFMTTVCNCKDGDTFCKPQNDSCSCRQGWSGEQCQQTLPMVSNAIQTSSSSAIVGGSVAIFFIVIIVAAGLIWLVRRKRKDTTKRKKGTTFLNAAYSDETPHVYCNENVAKQSAKTKPEHTSEYSLANPVSEKEESGTEYVATEDYNHIEFTKDKNKDTTTAVYSHLTGNAESATEDGGLYDTSARGRQSFDNYTSNDYGIIRQAKSSTDDTYDSTVH